MLKYPAETFLKRLAVFAESNELDWSEAFFRDQIETKKNRSQASKDPWVINCDLVKEEGIPAVQKGRITEVGDEEQKEEEEEKSSSLSVSIEENGKTAKSTVAERGASGSLTPVNGRNLPLSSPPPPPPSSVPTTITPSNNNTSRTSAWCISARLLPLSSQIPFLPPGFFASRVHCKRFHVPQMPDKWGQV